jgi:uncharacterized protein YjbI with pentapeptide repeats
MDSYLAIANSPLLWVFLAMVAAAFGIMWITSLEVKQVDLNAGWLRRNYVMLLMGAATLLAVSALYFYLFGIGVSLSGIVARLRMAASDQTSKPEDLRHLGTTVALLMGVLAAAATIFFSIIRVWINERTASAAEEGLITDRISKAVEGLGAEKTVKDAGGESTKPNLEVRIGAIYALERIAQDSLRDHIQIMEILCAYIRENAPLRETPKNPFAIWEAKAAKHRQDKEMPQSPEIREWARNLEKPRTDIQLALEVIGRRKPRQIKNERAATVRGSKIGYRLDLRSACLQGADLSELDFTYGLLEAAQLEGADLDSARLQRTDLRLTQLQGAYIYSAQLQEAYLSGAQLQGADLSGAWLHGANLVGAKLQAANFDRVKLHGADIYEAKLDALTSFYGATFKGSALKGVDFSDSTINMRLLKTAFGDATTILPSGHGPDHENWPELWSKEKLDWDDFETEWRAHQARIGQDPDNPA